MFVSTKIVIDVETSRVLEHQGYDYNGSVDFCCGASQGQKMANADLRKTSKLMDYSFQQIMGENLSILGKIRGALEPIVKGGASQYGFSPAEDAARRTQATAELARASRSASGAVRSALSSRGGGNILLPSGSEASIESDIAQQEAYAQANAQLGITEKGYETGRENFFRGTGMLAAAPGELESPITSAGGAAVSGAQAREKSEDAITAANRAWMKPVAGLIGGLAGAIPGLGALGAGISGASKSVGG